MHVSARKCSRFASDESFLTKTPKPEYNNFVRITFGFEIEIQANIQSRYGWCVSASFINFMNSRDKYQWNFRLADRPKLNLVGLMV